MDSLVKRNGSSRRVALFRQATDLAQTVSEALEYCGILDRIEPGMRVALKPNFTYPRYKTGVTTSPAVVHAAVRVLSRYTDRIAIVESDGGGRAWTADEAFAGHDLLRLRDEFGVELVNLSHEPSEALPVESRGGGYTIPLPVRLLHETDLLITMPVPKVHAMTRITLAYKNQWGCIPDIRRLRNHHMFDDAVLAIDRALRPAVLADGTWFLDRNGPMDGEPVRMDLILAGSDAGAFDRYVSELMGVPWKRVAYLRRAEALGLMPGSLREIVYNVAPAEARTRRFRLRRNPRNYIALAGFRSRFLTWLGYESWFGRVVLHAALYAVAKRPVMPGSEGQVTDLAAAPVSEVR